MVCEAGWCSSQSAPWYGSHNITIQNPRKKNEKQNLTATTQFHIWYVWCTRCAVGTQSGYGTNSHEFIIRKGVSCCTYVLLLDKPRHFFQRLLSPSQEILSEICQLFVVTFFSQPLCVCVCTKHALSWYFIPCIQFIHSSSAQHISDNTVTVHSVLISSILWNLLLVWNTPNS